MQEYCPADCGAVGRWGVVYCPAVPHPGQPGKDPASVSGFDFPAKSPGWRATTFSSLTTFQVPPTKVPSKRPGEYFVEAIKTTPIQKPFDSTFFIFFFLFECHAIIHSPKPTVFKQGRKKEKRSKGNRWWCFFFFCYFKQDQMSEKNASFLNH